MSKKIFLILSLFLLYSCDDNIVSPTIDDTFLDIYLEDTQDNNGFYHIEYQGYTYHHIYYETTADRRVYWNSPNTFIVEFMYQEFETPIISNSTYADNLGYGQQLFYIDNTQIGDTLMLYGYVNENAWDYLYFILEDNNE